MRLRPLVSACVLLLTGTQAGVPASGPVPRVDATHGTVGDGFGFALVALGDLDRDGIAEIAVSAPAIELDVPGSVRVLVGRTGAERAKFAGADARDEFGYALAAIDWDRNGVLDLVIGARLGASDGAPGEGFGRGVLHVVAGGSGKLIWRTRGETPEQRLGAALAGIDDVDNDKHGDLVVGSPGMPLRGPDSGAVEVWSGRTGRPLRTLLGLRTGERLGERVAAIGDVTGDGLEDFVATAPAASFADLPDTGRVEFVCGRTGASLGALTGTVAGEFFGRGLLGGFGWNNDGVNDVAIGSPFAQDPAQPRAAPARSAPARRGALVRTPGAVTETKATGRPACADRPVAGEPIPRAVGLWINSGARPTFCATARLRSARRCQRTWTRFSRASQSLREGRISSATSRRAPPALLFGPRVCVCGPDAPLQP